MILTALPLPVLPDVPDVDPVVHDPEDVVLNASLLFTVTLCVCAPSEDDAYEFPLEEDCAAHLAVPDPASLLCATRWLCDPALAVVAVCV